MDHLLGILGVCVTQTLCQKSSDLVYLVPLVLGVVLVFLSGLGCVQVKAGNPWSLICLSVAYVVFGLLVSATAVFLIVIITQYVRTIVASAEATSSLSPGIGNVQHEVADFLLGLAQGCCTLSEQNQTLIIPNCDDGFYENPVGDFMYCFIGINGAFLSGVNVGQEQQDDGLYCTSENILSACAGYDVHAFLDASYSFLNTSFLPGCIALAVLGGLLIMSSICSCCLMRSKFRSGSDDFSL